MIDEVRGNNYYSEPIAFELDDSDIKGNDPPICHGQDNRYRAVYKAV